MMSIEHNGFTFSCALGTKEQGHGELTVRAKTERTAIEHARADGWDVLWVRATLGVPNGKVARSVRLVFCPGCAFLVGVTFR